MQVVKDKFGNEISIGDALVHVVKKSTSVGIHYSIVYGFIWCGDNYIQLKVVSAKKHYYRDELECYRARLTTDNFIKISLESVPMHIREKLMALIKV